jgi:hypothetical protein
MPDLIRAYATRASTVASSVNHYQICPPRSYSTFATSGVIRIAGACNLLYDDDN